MKDISKLHFVKLANYNNHSHVWILQRNNCDAALQEMSELPYVLWATRTFCSSYFYLSTKLVTYYEGLFPWSLDFDLVRPGKLELCYNNSEWHRNFKRAVRLVWSCHLSSSLTCISFGARNSRVLIDCRHRALLCHVTWSTNNDPETSLVHYSSTTPFLVVVWNVKWCDLFVQYCIKQLLYHNSQTLLFKWYLYQYCPFFIQWNKTCFLQNNISKNSMQNVYVMWD